MRTIKAILEVSEDSNLAGVHFLNGRKKIEWNDLTRKEQIHILNGWAGHHGLFSRFIKEE